MSGSIEFWGYLSIVCFVFAAVFLIIAIVMFFSFDIRKIRRELSVKHVELYMEEYRRKKEENKRVGIYDPSGKLISNVGKSTVSNESFNSKPQTPIGRTSGGINNQPMGDAIAKSRASASIKTENATQVLINNNNKFNNFIIIKDFIFSETSEYIG